MPYREKIAWLSITAMLLTFGPYFVYSALNPPTAPLPDFHRLWLYGIAAVVQMIGLGLGHLILRRRFPDDARQALDEREQGIDAAATRIAYFVLIGGMILAGGIAPFYESGWKIVNAALFYIALAEFIRYSIIIYRYRQDRV